MNRLNGTSTASGTEASEDLVVPSSEKFLEIGFNRFQEVSDEEVLLATLNTNPQYPRTRGTWEVAAVIGDLESKLLPNQVFLNLVKPIVSDIRKPQIWSFDVIRSCKYEPPRVFSKRWENYALRHCQDARLRYEYFNIYDPKGQFYHIRSADDDLFIGKEARQPGQGFDVHLPFVLCLRAIETIQKIAKIYEIGERESIELSCRWRGLKGRKVVSWVLNERFFSSERKAYQDEKTVSFSFSYTDSLSRLITKVSTELLPVYHLFEGFEPGEERIQKAVNEYFDE